MSRRRKRRAKKKSTPPPAETSGIVLLLSETAAQTLDLHGLTAAQAAPRVRDFLATQQRTAAGRVVHIVTGKGTKSDGKPVLLGLVRDMLDEEGGGRVSEFAGMLGGGGWAVRLRQ
jgi:Smr domain-containing protein